MVSKKVEITIIVAKKKPKNKGIMDDDSNVIVDSTGRRKYAFATNIRVNTQKEMQELIDGYKSRWSIESMFKDKNKLYGKTTSSNNVIRDFYFSYTMILFNLWILCNIILMHNFLKHVPLNPVIRIKTFRRYIRNHNIEDPPPESQINSNTL